MIIVGWHDRTLANLLADVQSFLEARCYLA